MPHLKDLLFEIVYDNEVFPIDNAPIGWQDLEKSGEIDGFFLTLWNKVDSSLSFIYDGADVLRKIMLTNGANVRALLRIYKRNVITNQYALSVRQDFDFQKWSDLNGIVTIGLKENSVANNIKTFLDVQYTIPVDTNHLAVSMNIGGIGLSEYVQFVGGFAEYLGSSSGFVFSPSMSTVENTTSPDIVEINSGYDQYTGPLVDLDTTDVFPIKNVSASPIEARFKGSSKLVSYNHIGPPFFDFFMYDDLGNKFMLKENAPLQTNVDIPGTQCVLAEFDVNITMQPGVKYTFVVDNKGGEFGTLNFEYVDLNIAYTTYTTDYTVKGLRNFDLLTEILNQINPNDNFTLTAPVLTTGLGKRIIVASGDCIRGILGATIQTSLRQFIASFNPQLAAGFKVYENGSIKMDKLSQIQFNKYANCGHLGTVKNAKYESIPEVYAGYYKVGYPDNSYDKADGRDEMNTETSRAVTEAQSVNNIEMMSEYRADARGVDELIIDYRLTPTRDNTGDKQNWKFVINEEPDEIDGLYHLTGPEIYQKVEGTSALGRIYNLELAPIFMFLRNSATVAVQFALKKMGSVSFHSSKKNGDLKITKLDESVIEEKMTVNYEDMLPPLYLPIKCTFTAVLTDEKYESMLVSANTTGGYIVYNDRGQDIKAFIVSYSYNLTNDNVKEFVVYLHPDNDVTKLFNLQK